MAVIINLDEIVGDDLVIQHRAAEYRIDGDIATPEVLRLSLLWSRLTKAETEMLDAEAGSDDEITLKEAHAKVTLETSDFLLGLLQAKQPDLTVLPFGHRAFTTVLGALLSQLNFDPTQDPSPGSGQTRKPASRSPRKKSPRSR